MSRLLWAGAGAGLAVAGILKGRRVVRRYTPQAVSERVSAQVRQTLGLLREAVGGLGADFAAARDERESELIAGLLADGQDPSVQTRGGTSGRHRHDSADGAVFP